MDADRSSAAANNHSMRSSLARILLVILSSIQRRFCLHPFTSVISHQLPFAQQPSAALHYTRTSVQSFALSLSGNIEFYSTSGRPLSRIMRPLVGWLSKLGLADEIWLKSAGLSSRLKLAFYDFFCRFQVQLVKVAHKLPKN